MSLKQNSKVQITQIIMKSSNNIYEARLEKYVYQQNKGKYSTKWHQNKTDEWRSSHASKVRKQRVCVRGPDYSILSKHTVLSKHTIRTEKKEKKIEKKKTRRL